MSIALKKYKTIVLDCDGVILDSNITKIDAYFRTARKLGASNAQAQALVDYHVKLGGISRYPKFVWYIEQVLGRTASKEAVNEYLETFSQAVAKGLMRCKVADGLEAFRDTTKDASWLVVSGSDQSEIRALFDNRALTAYFDGGVFGSPDTKDEIFRREIENGNIQMPALFIGDSKYDYESSKRAGLDFIFLSGWTDVTDWKAFCKENNIQVLPSISSLLKAG